MAVLAVDWAGRMRWYRAAVSVVVLLCSVETGSAAGQQPQPAGKVAPEIVRVVPGPGYRVDGLPQRLVGEGWRELWLTPVEAPVLDLNRHRGGLEVQEAGGGAQTRSLHLVEHDGWREYRFRSVDKFTGFETSYWIRGTPVASWLRQYVSHFFPAAPLLLPPFLNAVGALHVNPELYVMPDDPGLGTHRQTFAGMLGTLEVHPEEAPDDEPGFAGARTIAGSDALFEELATSRAHRLDEREYLAVRLVDLLVNDTDRTPENVRWARFGEEGTYRWRPIARDRDRAFVNATGVLNRWIERSLYSKLVVFGAGYSLAGLTDGAEPLDRRLLQRLTRSDFAAVGRRVQEAIDDRVISEALGRLPREWRERSEPMDRLRSVLAARRATLPDIALAFYDRLAREVDVHGTDQDERAAVVRHEDGRVTVTVGGDEAAPPAGAEVFFQRTFLPGETREVRLHLAGGDDIALVHGSPTAEIVVRLVGGEGGDVLVDSAGGGATHLYDDGWDDTLVPARGTAVSLEPWVSQERERGPELLGNWVPDHGSSSGWGPGIDYHEGAGLIIGLGPSARAYGFRRLPHHWELAAKLWVGTGNGRFGVTVAGDYRLENSPLALTLSARATQLDAYRFYGFGNDTPRPGAALALVEQDRLALEPALVWRIGWRSRVRRFDGSAESVTVAEMEPEDGPSVLRPLVGRFYAGPVVAWTDAEPAAGSPLEQLGPLAREGFGRAGLRLGLELDRTDRERLPRRGWTLRTELSAYPEVWDVRDAFAANSATATAYLPLADGPYLAFRAGGTLASGGFPVQDAAFVGGRTTLRGYRWQRYAGDASAYASAELRVPTGSHTLLVRWDTGIFGLTDAGRVWHDGRSDGGWHTGVGGGLWLSTLGQVFSLTYARGEEHRVYVQTGLAF